MEQRPDFVSDLRQQLTEAAPRADGHRRRRTRLVGALASLAVVAGAAVSVPRLVDREDGAQVVAAGGDEASSTSEAVEAVGSATWSEASTVVGGEATPSVFWTSSEVLVLRTENGGNDVTGELWDPATGTATRIADSGLNWRVGAATAWTGSEVLLVGGSNGPGLDQIGAAYDPTTDTWRAIADPPGDIDAWENALVGPGIWTGTEMLVWKAGLAYDPAADSWRAIAASPLSARSRPSTVWTGSELVIWGGCRGDVAQCDDSNSGLLGDGARYDPATDTWTSLPPAPLPPAVQLVSGWTGTDVVYSVTEDGNGEAGATALYDPIDDSWRTAADLPLSPRRNAAAVVSGGQLVVWGGGDGTSDAGTNDGAIYDPAADRWELLPTAPVSGRSLHTMIDTGQGIYVSATRTQGPPMWLVLPNADPSVVDDASPAEPLSCVPLPDADQAPGLVGLPIGEVWPQGFKPGFDMSEHAIATIDDPALEGRWYAVGTFVRDLGGRSLGIGVWLVPDPIVAYTGAGSPSDGVDNASDWHLYSYNDLARSVSIWRAFEIEDLEADPEAVIADCLGDVPDPLPFLAGQLLDGAEWILTDDPEHGLCLAESGLDYGCDDIGPVVGPDDPPETMRFAGAADLQPGIDVNQAGDLAYGYLPDGAVSVALLDADGGDQLVEVVLDVELGMWAAPIRPGDNPIGVRYLDPNGEIVLELSG